MKITVVTVCRNAADCIEPTLRSVVEQTYPDIEYIVIDGASTDGTLDIVKRYSDRIAKIVSEPDKGIYDAMNKAIRLAKGEYINFMNAGDTFTSPTAVAEVAERIAPGCDVVYGDSTMIGYDGKPRFDPAAPSVEMLRKRPVYRHNASFTRTSLHKEVPFALEKKGEFRYALDYNQIFTLWSRGASFRKVDVDVVTWDKTGTSNREVMNIRLMYRISHQFRKPTATEKLTYAYDLLKAVRRDIIRKLHASRNNAT